MYYLINDGGAVMSKMFLMLFGILFLTSTVVADEVVFFSCVDTQNKKVITNSVDGLFSCIEIRAGNAKKIEDVIIPQKENGFLYYMSDVSTQLNNENKVFNKDEIAASTKFKKENVAIFENAIKEMQDFNKSFSDANYDYEKNN